MTPLFADICSCRGYQGRKRWHSAKELVGWDQPNVLAKDCKQQNEEDDGAISTSLSIDLFVGIKYVITFKDTYAEALSLENVVEEQTELQSTDAIVAMERYGKCKP
ncbi:unnamed protein product [Echinostoma caproni]|uniref:Uncharacterized protein n=1 Tax=Echinostoma caproni TaxID=27848 RepID=A0A183BA13_9TREM|nr:unnamed protein product [Echinostoma caproni]